MDYCILDGHMTPMAAVIIFCNFELVKKIFGHDNLGILEHWLCVGHEHSLGLFFIQWYWMKMQLEVYGM